MQRQGKPPPHSRRGTSQRNRVRPPRATLVSSQEVGTSSAEEAAPCTPQQSNLPDKALRRAQERPSWSLAGFSFMYLLRIARPTSVCTAMYLSTQLSTHRASPDAKSASLIEWRHCFSHERINLRNRHGNYRADTLVSNGTFTDTGPIHSIRNVLNQHSNSQSNDSSIIRSTSFLATIFLDLSELAGIGHHLAFSEKDSTTPGTTHKKVHLHHKHAISSS